MVTNRKSRNFDVETRNFDLRIDMPSRHFSVSIISGRVFATAGTNASTFTKVCSWFEKK